MLAISQSHCGACYSLMQPKEPSAIFCLIRGMWMEPCSVSTCFEVPSRRRSMHCCVCATLVPAAQCILAPTPLGTLEVQVLSQRCCEAAHLNFEELHSLEVWKGFSFRRMAQHKSIHMFAIPQPSVLSQAVD
eukprot:6472203-Amphidinium_carterae.1